MMVVLNLVAKLFQRVSSQSTLLISPWLQIDRYNEYICGGFLRVAARQNKDVLISEELTRFVTKHTFLTITPD